MCFGTDKGSCLTIAAEISAIATFALLVVGYGAGRRQARRHLSTHMRILSHWCAGPNGQGWDVDSITPANRLDWIHPRYSVVPQFSADPIADLGLLQNVFMPEALIGPIAEVSQSLLAFNARLATIEEMKRNDVRLYLIVGKKLNTGLREVFGDDNRPAPRDATLPQLHAVIAAADLDEAELRWVEVIGGMMETLHTEFIGKPEGTGLAGKAKLLGQALEAWA